MKKPKLAVWKFASCDGCQLTLLDCEDEILDLADHIQIANFMEATSTVVKGPYDLSLVEGSITTKHDFKRIKEVREQSKFLVSIGACATAGGVQALRNLKDVKDFVKIVYAKPSYIDTLEKSHPISDVVKVDFELRGCPISKSQLLDVVTSFLHNKKTNVASQSVCVECKLKANICIAVSENIPCLGPVTHAGCNALCPSFNRGCFGCFGPKENPNILSLAKRLESTSMAKSEIQKYLKLFIGQNSDQN